MITLVVNNQKGGTGKTTIACHLAWYYAERGSRVLAIDLDTQGNFSMVFESCGTELPAELLFSGAIDPSELTLTPLTLAVGSRELGDVDDLDREAVVENFMVNMERLAPFFDVAIVDTPPAWGIRNYAGLLVADYVVGPMDLQDFAVKGIGDLLNNIQAMIDVNPRLKFLGLLPNRFRWNSTVQKDHLKAVLAMDDIGELVLPQVIALRTAYETATQLRTPVWKLPKGAGKDAGEEILKLLDHIQGKMGVQHAEAV